VEDALLEQGPKSLLLGRAWRDRERRVAARAARARDQAALATLEAATRSATDRGARGALAVLRGARLRYAVRKPEVLLGRSTDEQKVDVDLALEGNASKVSRQHALLQRRSDGRFFLRNVGRRAVYVNNTAVESGARALLPPDCLLEVGGIRLLFLPNARPERSPATPEPPAREEAVKEEEEEEMKEADCGEGVGDGME